MSKPLPQFREGGGRFLILGQQAKTHISKICTPAIYLGTDARNPWLGCLFEACSVKPPPGRDVFRQLCEHIMKDGFVTSGEPLLVSQPEDLQVPVEPPQEAPMGHGPHSLGYIKGQARSTTLLTVLHYCYSKNVDLKKIHPVLYESCLKIYILKVQYSTKADEALANMKLSARGSVRRANNLVITVMMLHNLAKNGLGDAQSFVRRWALGVNW
jgi:hypothetical protein